MFFLLQEVLKIWWIKVNHEEVLGWIGKDTEALIDEITVHIKQHKEINKIITVGYIRGTDIEDGSKLSISNERKITEVQISEGM